MIHALQILGSLAVVAAFASCAFDNGSLRWAFVALLACIVGTVIEFVLGAWPLGVAAGALSVVAGRRWRRRSGDAQARAREHPARDPHPHA